MPLVLFEDHGHSVFVHLLVKVFFTDGGLTSNAHSQMSERVLMTGKTLPRVRVVDREPYLIVKEGIRWGNIRHASCAVAIASQRESAELYTQPTYKVLLATVVVGKVIPTARNDFELPVVQVKALAVPLSSNRKIIF